MSPKPRLSRSRANQPVSASLFREPSPKAMFCSTVRCGNAKIRFLRRDTRPGAAVQRQRRRKTKLRPSVRIRRRVARFRRCTITPCSFLTPTRRTARSSALAPIPGARLPGNPGGVSRCGLQACGRRCARRWTAQGRGSAVTRKISSSGITAGSPKLCKFTHSWTGIPEG